MTFEQVYLPIQKGDFVYFCVCTNYFTEPVFGVQLPTPWHPINIKMLICNIKIV